MSDRGFPDIEVIGEASNGKEAVNLTEQLQPAAVVMDITMPLMNGIETTGRIKLGHPGIVVIGLTVNASPTIKRPCKRPVIGIHKGYRDFTR